jgi:OFA family oxalate/formate antiporter-like MFS transporter
LKWFKDRRGLAAGIMAAGFGGGTALFIPIISRLINGQGYRFTFLVTGLVQGIVILTVAQFLRHPPPEPVAAARAGQALKVGRQQFTTAEMLSMPQFYVMYLMFVLMATGGLLVTANAGPMAKSWGLPAAALTLAGTLSPMANGASRIFWGWVSDRLGREYTMVVAFGLQAVCLCLVVAFGRVSGGWFAFTLVLVYFTWGEIFSLFPAMSADYFGTRHATSNYGVLYSAKGVASIMGAWVAALLYEQTNTWSIGFYGSATMALIAAGLAIMLKTTAAREAATVVVAEAK